MRTVQAKSDASAFSCGFRDSDAGEHARAQRQQARRLNDSAWGVDVNVCVRARKSDTQRERESQPTCWSQAGPKEAAEGEFLQKSGVSQVSGLMSGELSLIQISEPMR